MANIDHNERQRFIDAYIAALFWTSTDGENGDEELEGDLSPEAAVDISVDCYKFITDNLALIEEAIERPGYDMASAGHDFWLTRNGHGAGYWDRDELKEGDLGDRLTTACRGFGGSDAYKGDSGLIYVCRS